MRLFLFVIFIGLVIFNAKSQTLSGKITDLKNNSLSYSDITVKDSIDNMIAYTIADAAGEYRLDIETEVKVVWVQANFMGFEKLTKKIELGGIHKLDFALEERIEEIQTIHVSAKAPVQIERNDTVVFNLDRLTNGTEDVVEDILKKLPGVEVDGSGRLKYKGKEVKKLLLDGDDLFQDNYTLGGKNVKAEHIAGVEAIQSYSDNPLLRGIENSDEVAINLKFKGGLSLSNTLSVAYGSSDKYSVDYKNIAVTKKLKTFSYLKFDNLGLKQSQYTYNPATALARDPHSEFENPGYLETGLKSSLFKSRQSNFNDALSASLNVLPKISETLKVRLNLDFIHDYAVNSHRSTTIIQSVNPIVIEEKKKSKFTPRYLKGDFNLTKYLSKSLSIENITKFSLFRNINKYSGLNNGVSQYSKSNSKSDFLFNETNVTKRLNSKNGLKLNAVFSCSETPEEIYVNPGIDLTENTNTAVNNESIENEKYQVQVQANYYHRTDCKNKFNFGAKYNYLNRNLYSFLTDGNVHSINDIQFEKSTCEFSTSYRWRYGNIEITPQIIYDYVDYNHTVKNGTQSLYNGEIRVKYKISTKHNIKVKLASNQEGIDDNTIFTNYILSSNRSLSKYQLDYGTIKNQSVSFYYNYLNSISFNQMILSVSGTRSNKSYLRRYDISQDVSYTNIYLGSNESESWNVFLLYGLPINWLHGKMYLTGKISYMQYVSELNSVLSNNYIHTYTANLRWESYVVGNFTFVNGVSYSKSDYGFYGNESMSNHLELFYHRKSFRAVAQFNYLVPSLNQGNEELSLNAKMQYKLGKFLITCEGVNLLNEKSVNLINQTDFMSTQNYAPRQSRYAILGLSFKF
jgi:hypothetical protein